MAAKCGMVAEDEAVGASKLASEETPVGPPKPAAKEAAVAAPKIKSVGKSRLEKLKFIL